MLFGMYQRRVVGLVLSIAALGLILGAIATKTWWAAVENGGSVRVGLRGASQCTTVSRQIGWYDDDAPDRSTRCEHGSLRAWLRGDLEPASMGVWDEGLGADRDEPRRVPSTFVFLGTLVFIAGIGAMIAIIVTAATAGRAPAGARTLPTLAAVSCGAFAGLALAFMVSGPDALRYLRPGPGLLLALAGAAAGIAGTLVLGRLDPSREPTAALLADADRAAPISRAPGLIAGAIGATLVLASLLTHGWFRGRDESTRLGIGVQDAELCRGPLGDSGCEVHTIPGDTSRAKSPARMKVFLAAGTAAWWTGLGAVIGFVLIGGLVVLRQAVGGPVSLSRVMHGLGGSFAAASLFYVVSKPPEATEISISFGAFAALGGAAALIGGAVMVGRWVAAMKEAAPPVVLPEGSPPIVLPAPPPLAPPTSPAPSPFARPAAPPEFVAAIAAAPAPSAAPAPVIPPCPRCGTPMLWVTAKNGYLCTICRER
jgi:hypothetical protein